MQAGASPLRVRVRRKTVEAEGVCGFELVAEDGGPLPPFDAGAHVDVEIAGFTRQYSLCGDPCESHRYLIAVLRERDGRGGSAAMHALLDEGSALRIGAPRNRFPLHDGAGRHLLLAGGIGVTPLIAMAHALSARRAEFRLHYCARSRAHAAFLPRLAASAFADRVRLHFDDGPAEQRLDIAHTLAEADRATHLYVCGPPGFMDAVLGSARAQGWEESRLHAESFGASDAPVEGERPFEIVLARSGRVVPVPGDRTAAQALLEAGVALETSCEQGICGTCALTVLDGVPEHRDTYFTPAEHAANDRFTPCCSRARGARLVVDL